ncbi:hypothetical protein [Streptomyces sp. NPDC000410]|uniref:hypothetical protein n=1 Tax=Streptomyces sp. NPDC000410 TaxID=3154254 RepID=UPI00332BFE30
MHTKRPLILLAPGLVASLALSPVVTTQALASPAPVRAAAAAPSVDPDPKPDIKKHPAYQAAYTQGQVQGEKDASSDFKKGGWRVLPPKAKGSDPKSAQKSRTPSF